MTLLNALSGAILNILPYALGAHLEFYYLDTTTIIGKSTDRDPDHVGKHRTGDSLSKRSPEISLILHLAPPPPPHPHPPTISISHPSPLPLHRRHLRSIRYNQRDLYRLDHEVLPAS